VWNNYLSIFRNPLNDNKVMPEVVGMLREYFEVMRGAIREIEKRMVPDYDLDAKI
jgi:hypothetical protein